MKTGISDFIARWRHTLGYGVHSPLAYRIATECLHPDPRYAMYADDYIDSVYGESARTARQRAYFLARMMNVLLPKCVWMPGGDRRTIDALRKSFPSIAISRSAQCPKNADFIAIFDNNDIDAAWKKLDGCTQACMVAFTPNPALDAAGTEAPTLVMTGRHCGIFIRREGMEPVSYGVL